MRISRDHSNRKAHNWLIYDISDKWLNFYKGYFVGNLYDLGCGESPYKSWLLQFADTYIGVDWSGSLHSKTADITANLNEPLPIESQVADIVLSLSVMEHLSEPQMMLTEAHRILKPGGVLILQVPWQWWIHEAPYDFFRYTPFGLKLLLERAGFSNVDVRPQAGFFTTVALKMNYFSRRFVCGPKFFRYLIMGFFSIFWYLNQKVAPWLDKLDRNWALEAPGYFVSARKLLANRIEP